MPNYIKDCYLEWTAKMAEVGHPVRDYKPVVPFPEGKQFSTAGTDDYPRPPVMSQYLYTRVHGQVLYDQLLSGR